MEHLVTRKGIEVTTAPEIDSPTTAVCWPTTAIPWPAAAVGWLRTAISLRLMPRQKTAVFSLCLYASLTTRRPQRYFSEKWP